MGVGRALVSQEMRAMRDEGRIIDPTNNKKLVGASGYDLTIENKVWILDTEIDGLTHPKQGVSFYRQLLELPSRQRPEKYIDDGFIMYRGFNHLFKIAQKIKLNEQELATSSGRSNLARVFSHPRLLADGNPGFDWIDSQYGMQELDLWLLVNPQKFNFQIKPGMAFNQLRFFNGEDAQLNIKQLRELNEISPLVYEEKNGVLTPSKLVISDGGLQFSLDAIGKGTEGVVALRGRETSEPVDLRRTDQDLEIHYEPILSENGKFNVKKDEFYLMASKEAPSIPLSTCVRLRDHHRTGMLGTMHYAENFHPGFRAKTAVFEVRPEENRRLRHGMPMSVFDFFHTNEPEEPDDGTFQGQVGPEVPKFFTGFDYEWAAKTLPSLEERVLVQDAKLLKKLQNGQEGFVWMTPDRETQLMQYMKDGFFSPGYHCEKDPMLLQIIPYVLFFDDKRQVYTYTRPPKDEPQPKPGEYQYREEGLKGKQSIGVGGHIAHKDLPELLSNHFARKVFGEVKVKGTHSKPKLIGTLFASDTKTDEVHFGMIYTIFVDGKISSNSKAHINPHMVSIDELVDNKKCDDTFETWSRRLVPHLPEIYKTL